MFFAVYYFSGRNAREESPGHAHVIESSYGSENGKTPFSSTREGKRSNQNHGCEVLLMYDPWSLTPQSPVRKGAGMGSGIRNQVGGLNITPA